MSKKMFLYINQSSSLLNGLISYWKLDYNLLDSHSVNNGVVTTASYTTGKSNGGFYFYDRSQIIDFGASEDFKLSDGIVTDFPFSTSYWIKYDSFGTFNSICRKRNSGFVSYTGASGRGIRFLLSKDSIFSGYLLTETESSLTAGVWHNIIHTYDATKTVSGMKTYVDGVLKTVTNLSSGVYTCINNTDVSNFYLTGTSFGVGAVHTTDEVGFWNRVLTATEVTEIYNSGSGKFYPF